MALGHLILGMQFSLVVVLVFFVFEVAAEAAAAAQAVLPQAKPGCTDHCGNLTIPYPFGIGPGCYMTEEFSVGCNTSTESPTAMWDESPISIANIYLAEGEMQITQWVALDCYDRQGPTDISNQPSLELPLFFTVSHTRNKFIAVGCDTYAIFRGYREDEERYTTGCMSICDNLDSVEQSCSGIGCCQIDVPPGLTNYTVRLDSYYNHTDILDFNPCSYAFIVEEGYFNFFPNKCFKELSKTEQLPVILNWEIGEGPCDAAEKRDDYACKANSKCANNDLSGYISQCLPGYQGNPYLSDGCQDIDECKVSTCEPMEGV